MKAIVIEAYGSAEVLKEKELPMPELGEDQVLVEVHATSVNPVDWKVREGHLARMLPFEFPVILGWDTAGVVKETGKAVTAFRPGDRVFARPATNPRGSYAEYTAIEEKLLAKIPAGISFEEAAAVPLTGETAWVALVETARIKAGDRVLIHAAAGGVGSFAVQIAKSFGAYVAATASAANEAFVRSLGADRFIDYRREDFETIIRDYDIVFDTMGGDIQKKSFNVLKKGGMLVSIVSPPDEQTAQEKGVDTGYFFLEPDGKYLEKLAELMERGQLKAAVGEVFPLTEEGLRDAHRLSETHHAKGKIVIKVK